MVGNWDEADDDPALDNRIARCIPCGKVGYAAAFRTDDPADLAEFRCPACRGTQFEIDGKESTH